MARLNPRVTITFSGTDIVKLIAHNSDYLARDSSDHRSVLFVKAEVADREGATWWDMEKNLTCTNMTKLRDRVLATPSEPYELKSRYYYRPAAPKTRKAR